MNAVQAVAPHAVRVLLADDTPEIRMLLRRCLEMDSSMEIVGEASNGVEAVDLAGRSQPDVILLDLAMPVMDGLQAMPRLRACAPGARIVVLSAFGAGKMEQRAVAAGASAFIMKGTGPDAILATIRKVVEGTLAETTAGSSAPSVEQAYKRRHDVLPLLTHELGNQLTVIQGFAEMLADGLGELPVETSRQFAQAIVRNSREMATLLEAVSEVRKLDLGTMELHVVEIDMADLVRRVIPDLGSLLGARQITLTLCEGGIVTGDPMRIRQVLTNLVSNAAKFTPAGTAVAVDVRKVGDEVELAVTDEGPGIPLDRHNELFQKFSRLDATVKGSGVGLYLSRGIARAHGGDLVIVPRPRGCRFALRLPHAGKGEGR